MEAFSKSQFDQLHSQVSQLSIRDAFHLLWQQYPQRVTFSTSFSLEDQVITHMVAEAALPITLFTLDTGRLFPETYSVWSSTVQRFGIPIKAYYPDVALLETFVAKNGPNAFYESVENRKSCCHIRKVLPLKRALAGNAVWITGLRSEHSSARHDLPLLEWDETNQLLKYHPLLHWTAGQVKAVIDEQAIPYNPLHDKGFVSIGCAPCTRAIRPGEDFRAGRWWWEDNSKKECGLHEKQH
ncbi:MAG: phosphoadenylyl-sulfate reductase [Bacteroidetes bacterium]|nr:phosphoadenylyl-sulfate reductase [Bacteroidota bacterium]